METEKGQHCPNLHPVYEDEEGKCYFRRQASLVQVNFADLLLLIYNYFDMSKKKIIIIIKYSSISLILVHGLCLKLPSGMLALNKHF